MWKNLFLGKSPKNRKFAPKIIEHLYILFSCVIVNVCIFIISFMYTKNTLPFINNVFQIIKSTTGKILLALILGSWVIIIINTIRIIRIIKKTTTGKLLVGFELLFSLLIITAPIALLFSMTALKFNELVYE